MNLSSLLGPQLLNETVGARRDAPAARADEKDGELLFAGAHECPNPQIWVPPPWELSRQPFSLHLCGPGASKIRAVKTTGEAKRSEPGG
eukprot:364993-Chlamydomonas_euryale.AAC.6